MKKTNILQFPVPEQGTPSTLLDALMVDPSQTDTIHDPEMLRAVQGELASRQIKLASLLTLLTAVRPEAREAYPDRMLTPDQVAERLGTTVEWVYKNWKTHLTFGVKVSGKQLRFSERKLERYVTVRQAA